MNLQSDITTIKGVGEKSATLFHKLHIESVKDLLFYFPRDYETFEEPVWIKDAKADEICTLRVFVCGAPTLKKVRNLSILNVFCKDSTGTVKITFFNMPYMKNILKSGQEYLFRGILRKDHTMEQPKIYKEEEYRKLLSFIQPRYSLTKGLSNQAISKAMRNLLSLCPLPEDILPQKIKEEAGLMDYREALHNIHFPENEGKLLKARNRLVFDEFFYFMLMLHRSREITGQAENQFSMIETAESRRFLEKLPFKLTKAQSKVMEEIKEDMTGNHVMSRLIQGDVGSGKTIVAFYALLLCISNGYQGAFMAPTEVLARQHFETLNKMTRDYGLPFKPVILTGSQTASAKKEVYAQIESGEANLIIGTHAVIQDKVSYKNLALVVTDEQHRFGVRQRDALRNKGREPHVLVMSATPIPRTLAIILYGDLQISVIDELPAGRKQIKNCVVGTEYRPKAYEFITRQVRENRQVYCICPMVEEGELDNCENVMDYTEKLKAVLPKEFRIASLHGKMRPSDKNRIMEDFSAGNIDVLVSTTVIEVGINVPNATVMMVENAERFGLAQLHQLRGRVGRGDAQSYCIFIQGGGSEETKKRLEILNQSNDGFFIASEDLRLRGPGDLFGVRQSGEFSFTLGDIYRDADILKKAADSVKQHEEELFSADFMQKFKEQNSSYKWNFVDFGTI